MSIPEAALISAGRLMVSSGSMTASVGRSRQWLIPVFTFIDRDVDLNEMFGAALGLAEPWRVTSVEFDQEAGRLDLGLDFPRGARFRCPEPGCAKAACGRGRAAGSRCCSRWRC